MTGRCPAVVGNSIDEIDTPSLVVDLDALESNIRLMSSKAATAGLLLRPHAKSHKCYEIASLQLRHGAVGICCQKVSEAEAMVEGGVNDVLVTNEIVAPSKLRRLAVLARRATIGVCVDSADGIDALSFAAISHGATIRALLEINVGQARCGIEAGPAVAELARRIDEAPGLVFGGLQAYHGKSQHFRTADERRAASAEVARRVSIARDQLKQAGIDCPLVSGGGTGSHDSDFQFDAITEIQAGSYIFMDSDYGRNLDMGGPTGSFTQSLFVKSAVISKPAPDRVVIDAGLKALSTDSGPPMLRDEPGIEYGRGGDEHGILIAPGIGRRFSLNQPVWIVPSHCDTTLNLYDWIVGVRGERVESIWPLEARGALT